MKLFRLGGDRHPTHVAPRAGAWIETVEFRVRAPALESPPARGRGLKQIVEVAEGGRAVVAPRAGAWIETCHT